jgi:hypothetical protein
MFEHLAGGLGPPSLFSAQVSPSRAASVQINRRGKRRMMSLTGHGPSGAPSRIENFYRGANVRTPLVIGVLEVNNPNRSSFRNAVRR